MPLQTLFATGLYRADLGGDAGFNAELEQACLMLAQEDTAGRAW